MKDNPINEIERFAKDRGIDKMKHSGLNYATNVVEELLELLGYDVPKENRSLLTEHFASLVETLNQQQVTIKSTSKVDNHDIIDAIADIIVFSVTELQKLKVSTEAVLHEVAKEINSRRGSIISGKFEKDLSAEAKKNWYKADYENV